MKNFYSGVENYLPDFDDYILPFTREELYMISNYSNKFVGSKKKGAWQHLGLDNIINDIKQFYTMTLKTAQPDYSGWAAYLCLMILQNLLSK